MRFFYHLEFMNEKFNSTVKNNGRAKILIFLEIARLISFIDHAGTDLFTAGEPFLKHLFD